MALAFIESLTKTQPLTGMSLGLWERDATLPLTCCVGSAPFAWVSSRLATRKNRLASFSSAKDSPDADDVAEARELMMSLSNKWHGNLVRERRGGKRTMVCIQKTAMQHKHEVMTVKGRGGVPIDDDDDV